jgi:hypothetical protein
MFIFYQKPGSMVVSLKPFQSLSKCCKISSGRLTGLNSSGENHFETPNNHFVPLENRIVLPENHIVPLKNHFVPVENHIVPPENHIVPVENHIVPPKNHIVPPKNHIVPGTGHFTMIQGNDLLTHSNLSSNPINFCITKMYDYEQQHH